MQKQDEVDLPDFRIFETNEFLKKIKKMSSRDATFLRNKLDSFVYPQIKAEPFWGNNIKKLQEYSPDTWRYRIGKFRLFYIVDQEEHVVYILTIDDRNDTINYKTFQAVPKGGGAHRMDILHIFIQSSIIIFKRKSLEKTCFHIFFSLHDFFVSCPWESPKKIS